jgi:hypothetical protein
LKLVDVALLSHLFLNEAPFLREREREREVIQIRYLADLFSERNKINLGIYAYNPSYSGNVWRILSWRPAQGKVIMKSCLKNKTKAQLLVA